MQYFLNAFSLDGAKNMQGHLKILNLFYNSIGQVMLLLHHHSSEITLRKSVQLIKGFTSMREKENLDSYL